MKDLDNLSIILARKKNIRESSYLKLQSKKIKKKLKVTFKVLEN